MEKYLSFDEQLSIKDDEIEKLQAELAALRAELAAAKEYHEAYREEMLEQLGELAALKAGDVEKESKS